MIFLQNVAKYFNGKPLFKDANISVHRGDRIGIVGANGAGKSTILGMMEGVLAPDEGEISIEKRLRTGVLHQELIHGNDGPIIQEVMNVSDELSLARHGLGRIQDRLREVSPDSEEMVELLREQGALQHEFERLDGYTLKARALKVLGGLGFAPEDGARVWSEFSGGWRMRVALAKILLADPDVLLLDEPTNHLDLESLLWVETYLLGYKGALVLVSHDRAFLNRLVNKTVEVDRGKVTVYTGNYDDFEMRKDTQEEIQASAYKNQQEKLKRIQKFIDQNRVKARTASRVQSRVKMMEKIEKVEPPRRAKTLKFEFKQPVKSGRRVVELVDIVKRYGEKTVYEDFSLAVDRGEKVGMVGPNGAGKSTLMKMIAAEIIPDAGTVKYGHNVTVGYFAQHHSENLNSSRSVLEEAQSVALGSTEQEVRTLLGAFLFSGDDVYKKVRVLSGGEKSRLALTKLLLAPPNFLLMDEPTNHLDIPSCQTLESALRKYDGTLLLITHDRRLMDGICSGILEVEQGRAEYYIGNYADYIYKKDLMEAEAAISSEQQSKPTDDKVQNPETRESRKERKRREAEARKTLSSKKAPITAEVRKIEQVLEQKESRRKEIQALMADPASYQNRDLMLPLLAEEPAIEKEIKTLEGRWTELQALLESYE
ncbi:MAG: ABC-F family ATP-binding cassette domain-containing protein [Pseudomonadota bacterium]